MRLSEADLKVLMVVWVLWTGVAVAASAGPSPGRKIPPRGTPGGAPRADLRQIVIWGSECRQPAGQGPAFGGKDQRSEDGRPHTRILDAGRSPAAQVVPDSRRLRLCR